MADESLLKEVESEDEDNMWWILRKLPIKLLIMFTACLILVFALDANGVKESYMFGWSAFLGYLGFTIFKND